MKNITLKLNEKHIKILTFLFNQLHLIIIVIVLLLFGVENTAAQCPIAPGNQTTYGSGSWIGYVYASVDNANPPSNVFTSTYRGYITQTETFDQNLGSGSLSGAHLCGTYSDQFSIRFKMTKNFTAGYYTFTVGGDDGYRLSLDSGATFPITNFYDHGYTTTVSSSYFLSGNTNLVLEYYEQGGSSEVSFAYTACTSFSTAPTFITGTASICSGTSTTLTATGGTLGTSGAYQWGTGTTVGSNIIAGQSGASITVNPTTTTTYWVRRTDPSPCATPTSGVTQAVTVTAASTDPTSITGTTSVCLGNSTTLTAVGGTLASGAVYEWGTGAAGFNIISGQTGASITVTPSTTTTYWVRRTNPSPCGAYTNAATVAVTVNVPAGDQTSYGSGSWIGYVYSGIDAVNPPSNIASATYRGYVTQSETFDQNIGGGSLTAANLCGSYTDQFFIRFKMTKNFTAGYYTFTVAGDDGYRLSLDGGATFPVSNFVDHAYAATTSTSYYLSGNTNLVIEYYEQTGSSQILFSYTACTNYSTAPTGLSGTTFLCTGAGGTTLGATGGYEAAGATYQWGTGSTVGSNIISGQTNSTYYINPVTTTTYWVRRVDPAPCNLTSAGVTQTITVASPSTNPTGITVSAATVCSGSSVILTASGGTLAAGGSYQWGTGYTAGSNIISGQTGISMTTNPTATSGYWVRRIDPAPCNTQTPGTNTTVTVVNPSTAPTSITGSGTIACAGNTTTLTAAGGTAATGSTYQWGTGSIVGLNAIAGQTGISIIVSPATTTTYWVRRLDTTPCSAYTTGVTTTVSIAAVPGNPVSFGSNVWNVYGYSTADITLATAVYAGYYSVNTLGVDTQNGTNSWANTASPSSSAGWSGCTVPVDNFTMALKRQGFPCGSYAIALANWDDDTQVYINGTLVWSCTSWSGGGACSGTIGTYTLDSSSTIEIRVHEASGGANVSMTLANNTVVPTAPTTISGTTTVCSGTATTLTATGGVSGTNGVFQWGTGSTVGSNIISGQTTAAISVSPTTATTYWVRRIDNACSTTTTGITQAVSVTAATVAGSLSTPATTICKNTKPNDITLSGQTGSVVKWQYATNAAFTTGVTDIASTATVLTSNTMGSISATRYYRAVVQNGSCTSVNTAPIAVTIPADITYSNGVWSGTPDSTSSIVISSNLTINSTLNACSCTIGAGVIVTLAASGNLVIQTSLTVDPTATFIVNDKASIVQVDDSAADIGKITVIRKTASMKLYDYTYWSAPVQNWTLNQLSPNTQIDKYYSFNPLINNWVSISGGNATMDPGRGYIVRSPNGWSATNASLGIYDGIFIGSPNNGVVPATIQKGTGTMNLIGNPYPSAIDIDLFLTDPGNAGIVNGTIYLWTHNTAISSTIVGTDTYNYTADDYAKYNLTGGVKTASTALTGGAAPTGKVASGQGFFIEANPALASGTYTANFKNSMRVASNNNQFFRVGGPAVNTGLTNTIEKNRLWLNITNTQGAYNEMLIGYITGATNALDNLYDGKTMSAGNVLSIYSLIGTETDTYSIQGRALPFNDSDIVPIGFKTSIAGNFTIAIENKDGLFETQNVYLVDKLNNITHDLKAGTYTFSAAIGTFDNRFEVHYTSNLLGTNSPLAADNGVFIYPKGKQVNVKSASTIESVTVYDLPGRTLLTAEKINAMDFRTTTLSAANQVLIVKVKLENGAETTKKVLVN